MASEPLSRPEPLLDPELFKLSGAQVIIKKEAIIPQEECRAEIVPVFQPKEPITVDQGPIHWRK